MKTAGFGIERPEPAWLRMQVPLFAGLGDADLAAIAACLVPRSFAAGDILMRQGVRCGELFIMCTGIVQAGLTQQVDGPSTCDVSLNRMVQGECCGEMSLLTGAPPSATVRALTDGAMWVLGQHDFLRLMLMQPDLARNINRILSERLLRVSRHHLSAGSEHVILLVGASQWLIHHLATTLSRFSSRATLCIDLGTTTADGTGEGPAFTLRDLLNGRLQVGAAMHRGAVAGGGMGTLTVVQGVERSPDAAVPLDLPTALKRLGTHYRHLLVALPVDHPLLTPHLIASATHVIVAGAANALAALRATAAALPMPAHVRTNLSLSIVVTEAPAALRPTVATLERLSGQLGAPVWAIVPDDHADAVPGALASLARRIAGQRIGLALGAGGAKGFAHLGVLRVLRRAGVPFDCVTGVSIGASVGAAIAMEATPERIEAGLHGAVARVFRPMLPRRGMLSNRALGAWLQGGDMLGQRLIEDLPIPFAACAADLTEGREIVLRRGLLWQAVLASTAIPGLYPAVCVGDQWLVDGGVVNPVPVSTAKALGADVVIAVDLSEPLAPRHEPDMARSAAKNPPSLVATLMRSRDIMMSQIRVHTVGEPSILIKPEVRGIGLRKFGEGTRFVEAGEAATETILPSLRAQLPWLTTVT